MASPCPVCGRAHSPACCPFCGSMTAPVVCLHSETTKCETCAEEIIDTYEVVCDATDGGCGAAGPGPGEKRELTEREALAAWDRRASGWVPVGERLPEPDMSFVQFISDDSLDPHFGCEVDGEWYCQMASCNQREPIPGVRWWHPPHPPPPEGE